MQRRGYDTLIKGSGQMYHWNKDLREMKEKAKKLSLRESSPRLRAHREQPAPVP